MSGPTPRWPLLLLAVIGCDRLGAAVSERVQAELEERIAAVGTEMPGTLPPPALDEQQRLADKLALYHECLRRSRGRVVESWRRWQAGIDPKTNVARRGGPKPLVYPVTRELQPCARARDEGPALSPTLPTVEHALSRYDEAARAFAGVADELDTYLSDEAYRSDAWAKGKELGPRLAEAFTAFDTAETALSAELTRIDDGLDELRLAQVEARHGRRLQWHCHRVELAAKTYAACVRGDPTEAGTCADPLADLQGHAEALRSYAEAHADERADAFWLLSFDAALGNFLADATAFEASLGVKKANTERERLREALRDRFEELRSAFDNLRFDLP